MTHDVSAELLSTIDTLYSVALTPDQYDAIAADLDNYISNLELDSDQAETLRKHIDQALAILDRLHMLPDDPALPADIVEAEHGPAALIDADGMLLSANSHWHDHHPECKKIIWTITNDTDAHEKIRAAMRTLHEISENRTSFVRITDVNDRFLNLSISRMVRSIDERVQKRFLLRTGEAIWSESIATLMSREFGLTNAEIQLLRRMVIGESFTEISDETGRAVETLKSQSKSIYRKMHATGREDAVRIAYQLHVLLRSGQYLKKPNTDSKRAIVRANGVTRNIAWNVKGKRGGQPVLFLHGMGLGYGITQEFEAGLIERGVELICLDRPGYGGSDPCQSIYDNVCEWAEMFPDILDALQIDRLPVLTHTSGVLYGCVAATHHPDRVERVCALAGGVPITDTHMLSDYPLQIRLLSRASRFSPQLLRFVFSSYAASYRTEKGRNKIIHRTYGNVPSDAAGLANPAIAELVHQGMSLVIGTGFDGFVGDGLRIFGDWSEYVRDMKVPLHYVIGEEDPICPFKWAESFAQRFAHVSVSGVPKAGQLLHHTKPNEVLGILDDIRFWPAK